MRSSLVATLVSVVGMLAVSPVAAAALASEPKSTASAREVFVLGGLTSQDFPVLIDVSKNGRQLTRAVVGIGLRCSSGNRVATTSGWTRVRVSAGRTFKATHRETFTEQGAVITASASLVGKLNARRTVATGRWTTRMVSRDPNGTVDTCDSGSVSFKARR